MGSLPTSLELRPLPARRGLLGLMQAMLCVLLGTGCLREGIHAPPEAPAARPSGTVVLVHGMYMGPSCWERWVPYLEARGYRTLAPAWPAHDGTAAAARAAHPDPKLAAVELSQVVDHYRKIIAELDEPPILIGHSMGGLVVQLLLDEGLGSAGVAIDAAPAKGVLTLHHAFVRSNGRNLRGSLDVPLDMDLERFSYSFVNTLPPAEQRRVWEEHARPESRRIGRAPTTKAAKIEFKRQRAPLLLIGGGQDHAVPPVIARKTFRRYRKAEAYTEYRELDWADHWLIASDRWQELAELTVDWLAARGASPAKALTPAPDPADPAPR